MNAELSFFPGAADVFEAASRDISTLEQRLGLISKADDRLARIDRMGAEGPPELLHAQTARLRHALRLLAAPAPDAEAVTAVEQTIGEVDAELQRIEDEDEAHRAAVLERAKKFWAAWALRWKQVVATAPQPEWLKTLQEQMQGFLAHAEQCFNGDSGADETLAALDTTFLKLKLVADYVRVCQVSTPEQTQRFDEQGLSDAALPQAAQRTQRQRFFECLSSVGAHALNQAQLVLRQAEQGIFVKQIAEQLEHGRFRVQAEPQSSVHALDPVRFRLVFLEDKFNGAAARGKLDCVWTFEHGKTTYEEHGWEASQAFVSVGKRHISVSVRRGAETIVPAGVGHADLKPLLELDVDVTKPSEPLIRQRTQLELVQLGVALCVTMGALASGAREQLEKLSLVSSVAAVFALGFGANVVKNIIARRPSSTPGSPS